MYAEKYLERVISWRRDIHSHPELSRQEQRTSELAANVLESLGLEVTRNIGGFGVVGMLRGNSEGRTIALRADMDALPLNEETGLSYASKNQGVMHACGHDTHTAMLLGAACALSEIRDRLKDELHIAVEIISHLRQYTRSTKQHGRMCIMSAGVHYSGIL